MNRPRIWSSHESHRPIVLEPTTQQIVVNFGNSKPDESLSGSVVINPVEAVALNRDKVNMKSIIHRLKLTSAMYSTDFSKATVFPIVVKRFDHSGGGGMRKITDMKALKAFLADTDMKGMYWERFIPFTREFRVHVSRHVGEIFATEKVFRKGQSGWVRNLKTCEYEPDFKKGNRREWKNMVRECKKYLNDIKLDIGGFDIGYRNKKYYIIECNSACGMKKETRAAYTNELNRICKSIDNGEY